MIEKEKEQIAERLLHIKRVWGVPYAHIARKLGVKQGTIARFAGGSLEVLGAEKCKKLKKILDMYFTELIDE